jgi:anti-sigma B factor antagonist
VDHRSRLDARANGKQARPPTDLHLVDRGTLDPISTPSDNSKTDPDARFHVETDGQATLVRLAGDIDVYNSPRVAQGLEQLIRQGHVTIILALEKLHFIDSSGLGVLVRAAKQARDAGGQLTLRAPSRSVRKVLEITGLNHIFTIVE